MVYYEKLRFIIYVDYCRISCAFQVYYLMCFKSKKCVGSSWIYTLQSSAKSTPQNCTLPKWFGLQRKANVIFTLEHLTIATWFLSPPPTLNPEFYQGLHMSPCCFWTAPLYLYPVRGWHCSCRSLCPQIQWHAEWGVSSQWSGCVRSWWGVAGSESTGWRIGSVLRQDQLWQCVWQWDLSKDRGGRTVSEHR